MEFETPCVMQPILGGLGNIDQCRITEGSFFEGVSLRLFDMLKQQFAAVATVKGGIFLKGAPAVPGGRGAAPAPATVR